jgi:AhpD family alkylhydroperoxidase
MERRMDLQALAPVGHRAVVELNKAASMGVDPGLWELIKIRSSMINGCAYCLDMHASEAIVAGEDVRRVVAVAAWGESPYFTPAERAVLDLTDQVTRLGEHGVTDDVWDEVCAHFSDIQVASIVLAISVINVWNRIAITTRTLPLRSPPRPPAPPVIGHQRGGNGGARKAMRVSPRVPSLETRNSSSPCKWTSPPAARTTGPSGVASTPSPSATNSIRSDDPWVCGGRA